jgi:hypothetical protein
LRGRKTKRKFSLSFNIHQQYVSVHSFKAHFSSFIIYDDVAHAQTTHSTPDFNGSGKEPEEKQFLIVMAVAEAST